MRILLNLQSVVIAIYSDKFVYRFGCCDDWQVTQVWAFFFDILQVLSGVKYLSAAVCSWTSTVWIWIYILLNLFVASSWKVLEITWHIAFSTGVGFPWIILGESCLGRNPAIFSEGWIQSPPQHRIGPLGSNGTPRWLDPIPASQVQPSLKIFCEENFPPLRKWWDTSLPPTLKHPRNTSAPHSSHFRLYTSNRGILTYWSCMDTAYVRETSPPKQPYKLQYLHFRYLDVLVKTPWKLEKISP